MDKFNLVKYMWFRKAHPKIRKISGTPPLTFKSNGKALKNYRIYGQTSRNLFDDTNGIVTDTYIKGDGTTAIGANGDMFICNRINVLPNSTYTFSWGKMVLSTDNTTPYIRVVQYNSNGIFLSRILISTKELPNNRYVVTVGNAVSLWDIRIDDASSTRGQHLEEVMLNSGSTPLPYEPYGESVGNLVTSGEHAGEYKVPVTVEGKNLCKLQCGNNHVIARVKQGVTYTFSVDVKERVGINFKKNTINGETIKTVDWLNGRQRTTVTVDEDCDLYLNAWTESGNLFSDAVSERQLEIGTEATEYEAYHAPTTTNLYLPEQIKDEAEYIDFEEQKQHFADGTFVDVTLPALPTITGTNTLSIGTEVKPSKIEITGRIKMSGGE